MKHAFDAIYENGTFRPLQESLAGVADGQRVRITIEDQTDPECLQVATHVYDGLSELEIDEVERIATCRGNFFGPRNRGA
jgi:predicted DNA-binding antitoxin AbrB/MazE fold protein